MTEQIIENLKTVKNMDDVRNIFDLEYTFNGYNYHRQLWELPEVKTFNSGKHIFSQVFFGAYTNPYRENSNIILIVGRTGNTHAYIIKGIKQCNL